MAEPQAGKPISRELTLKLSRDEVEALLPLLRSQLPYSDPTGDLGVIAETILIEAAVQNFPFYEG